MCDFGLPGIPIITIDPFVTVSFLNQEPMWCRVGSWFKNNIVAKGPIATIGIPGGPKSHHRDTWETKIAQLEPIEQKLHNRDN